MATPALQSDSSAVAVAGANAHTAHTGSVLLSEDNKPPDETQAHLTEGNTIQTSNSTVAGVTRFIRDYAKRMSSSKKFRIQHNTTGWDQYIWIRIPAGVWKRLFGALLAGDVWRLIEQSEKVSPSTVYIVRAGRIDGEDGSDSLLVFRRVPAEVCIIAARHVPLEPPNDELECMMDQDAAAAAAATAESPNDQSTRKSNVKKEPVSTGTGDVDITRVKGTRSFSAKEIEHAGVLNGSSSNIAVDTDDGSLENSTRDPNDMKCYTCPHACGCAVFTGKQLQKHRQISKAGYKNHVNSTANHPECDGSCPVAALHNAAEHADSTPCPHACGCALFDGIKDDLILYRRVTNVAFGKHVNSSQLHPQCSGKCPEHKKTTKENEDKHHAILMDDDNRKENESEEAVENTSEEDGDESLAANLPHTQYNLLTPRERRERYSIQGTKGARWDIDTIVTLDDKYTVKLYHLIDERTNKSRALFVHARELMDWWNQHKVKKPITATNNWSVPAEKHKCRLPDVTGNTPVVFTSKGIFRLATQKWRVQHGTQDQKEFLLTRVLPRMRQIAPTLDHPDTNDVAASVAATAAHAPALDTDAAVAAAAPACEQVPGQGVQQPKVKCAHSCGCVDKSGLPTKHKEISQSYIDTHQMLPTVHPFCTSVKCTMYSPMHTKNASAAAAVSTSSRYPLRQANATTFPNPTPSKNEVDAKYHEAMTFWKSFTLKDLRYWGRDCDAVAEMIDDSRITKDELISLFIELDVPKPGRDGNCSMKDHIAKFTARMTDDEELEDRQVRACQTLEQHKKRDAAAAAAHLSPPPSIQKKQKQRHDDQPFVQTQPQLQAQAQPYQFHGPGGSMPFGGGHISSVFGGVMPPPGMSPYGAAMYCEYLAQHQQQQQQQQQQVSVGSSGFGYGQPPMPPFFHHYVHQPAAAAATPMNSVFNYTQQPQYQPPSTSGAAFGGMATMYNYSRQPFAAAAAAAATSDVTHHPYPPAVAREREIDDRLLCIVCKTRERSVVFPCSHFVCCRDCAEDLRSTTRICPECRGRFGYKTMVTNVRM